MVLTAAFPAVRRFAPCLLRHPSKGIVKDHDQVFCAQGLTAVMTHRDRFLTVIVALSAFPAHCRVIPFH
jgi:hypothetical protein